MIHFAIAVGLSAKRESFPTPEFLLGSIAPDAIHMRPNIGPDDKKRVHLRQSPDSSDEERIRALFVAHCHENAEAVEFAQGYTAHLLADQLWRKTVFASFRERRPQELTASQERSLYYDEADQIDFDLYNGMPWRPRVWQGLAAAQARDFADLLTGAEIRSWQERTLKWFDSLKEEPKLKPVYLTLEIAHNFVEQAVEMTAKHFASWNKDCT